MFIGISRAASGKSINNDAFLSIRGNYGEIGILMDGSGEAGGASKLTLNEVRQRIDHDTREGHFVTLRDVLKWADLGMLGRGQRSTFLAAQQFGGRLHLMSIGDSRAWVYQAATGVVGKVLDSNMGRLGANFHPVETRLDMHRGDVLILTSDGYTVEPYRMGQVIKKWLLRPLDMTERLFELQKERHDDTTVVTMVF